jgi:signal transduction histidine kinase
MLDHLGLVSALEFLVGNITERTGLRIIVGSTLRTRVPQRLATPFYRIVQEAVNNVLRHAQASSVQIRINIRGSAVRCTVSDDGVGFDPDQVLRSGPRGLGLVGIQERIASLGGALRIDSAKGRGAKLEITAPLKEDEYAVTRVARGRSSDRP